MATGVYGIQRPATPDISDIEIFYTFSPSRETITTGSVNRLNPNDVLQPVKHPDSPNQILGGLYSLKLPSTNFNTKGFYNIIIRAKEFKTKIVDCGMISAVNIKGLILDTNRSELVDFQNKFITNGLTGHRIEYLESNGSKTPNKFVIITSSNRCEPVVGSVENTTQKSVSYRLTDAGSLVFLTVTPSSSSSVKPNAIPEIGSPNQDIIISNTFINPIHLEIEMVEWTTESLAILLAGNQVKSLADGQRISYDFDNNIFKSWNEFEILDEFSNPLFEIREQRKTIDTTKIFSDIISGLD